jgi:regulator of sigma E protease
MEFISDFWGVIVPFLVVLTILVFVHEMGHYWVARRNGVRVEVFSIGFGPEIFGRTDKAGTRWKFSAIPLGGYVKMFGDSDASSRPGEGVDELSEEEKRVTFFHKRLGQRIAIVAAGPLANFIFAVVLLTGLFSLYGQPFTPPEIGEVQPGSAAESAGFQPGDVIVRIGDTEIERFEQIQRIIAFNPNVPLEVAVERDGSELVLQVTPERVTDTDNFGNEREIGRLGVRRGGFEYIRHDPFTAAYRAVGETYEISAATLRAVGEIITGRRSADELGGPIRIAQMSGQVAEIGIEPLIWFMALLSVNLGLINLFPIPMLDGGHLLFYAIEAVRGRPLGERAQEYGFRIGLALVLSLMIFVTWNDLANLQVFEFIRNLVT